MQSSPIIHFTVKEFYAYFQAWMPLPFRCDVGNAASKNNAPRQPSAALTGHLHQNTNGESHENGLLGLKINAAHRDIDGFSGMATVDGRIHWTKDEWDLEIKARRKTPI